MNKFRLSLIVSLFFLSFISSDLKAFHFMDAEGHHRVFVSPEFIYSKREREGGTHQDGLLSGARLGYERIKRYGYYWGIDGYVAYGKMEGKNSAGSPLISWMLEMEAEARLGYTFQFKSSPYFAFTPFFGIGLFRGVNEFEKPNPRDIKFIDTYKFATWGFSSSIQFNDCWRVGVISKFRLIVDAEEDIEDGASEVTSIIGEEYHWEIYVPVTTRFCYARKMWEVSFIPFYRYRHLGGRENYPYDFFDTKFYQYGGRVEAAVRF